MSLHPNAQFTSHQLPTCRPPYWCFGNADLDNFAGTTLTGRANAEPCKWVTLDMEIWFCKWCRHVHRPEAQYAMPFKLAAAVPMRWTPPTPPTPPRPESRLRGWGSLSGWRERMRPGNEGRIA